METRDRVPHAQHGNRVPVLIGIASFEQPRNHSSDQYGRRFRRTQRLRDRGCSNEV